MYVCMRVMYGCNVCAWVMLLMYVMRCVSVMFVLNEWVCAYVCKRYVCMYVCMYVCVYVKLCTYLVYVRMPGYGALF